MFFYEAEINEMPKDEECQQWSRSAGLVIFPEVARAGDNMAAVRTVIAVITPL